MTFNYSYIYIIYINLFNKHLYLETAIYITCNDNNANNSTIIQLYSLIG